MLYIENSPISLFLLICLQIGKNSREKSSEIKYPYLTDHLRKKWPQFEEYIPLKIKQIHNLNARALKLFPIWPKGYTNLGKKFQHSSIQIVDLFDFVPLKSFFHVFDPPGGDFEKIIDKYCFCYMYYFVAIKEGCIEVMHIWKMVKKIFLNSKGPFKDNC